MWRVVPRHPDGWHRAHCRWRPWHLVNLAATMVLDAGTRWICCIHMVRPPPSPTTAQPHWLTAGRRRRHPGHARPHRHPPLAQAAASARTLHDAISFRLQWRRGIPGARHIAAAFPDRRPQPAGTGPRLTTPHRTRRRLAERPSYGVVRAGTLTATTGSGALVTLGPGATWDPSHQLRQATRRATFVHVDSTALHQILTPSPAGT